MLALRAVDTSAADTDHRHEPIAPIVAEVGLDPRKVDLGRQLFADPILSGNGTVSCATCHDLAKAGVDGLAHSFGIGGAEGALNAPTVYNSGPNLAQFWDGRARGLEDQAGGPITNPLEMGASWPEVIKRLKNTPYRDRFQTIWGADPKPETVKEAIASFERALTTPNSRFDRWLMGDDQALTADEREGYELFKSYGCSSCHQGANVGGNMFQRFGFFGNPFADKPKSVDFGRFNVTGNDEDRYVFKVPSLRLAALTAPYFHDGSVADLHQAIDMMATYQLGRKIPPAQVDRIIKFLGTLPGDMNPTSSPDGDKSLR